jgi:catechol 2,3-dioxygenase-like lactoylglutathione lyase family enzyme
MEPRISFVTLGVADLERSTQFYAEGLGLPRRKSPPMVSFFEMGPTWLALYPRHLLAADAGVAGGGSDQHSEGAGFQGFALAHNVRSAVEADQILTQVALSGGRVTRPARPTDWGGYAGYFADPDGFLWEVAWNPKFPIG